MAIFPDASGYLIFESAIGHCGLAWGERGITGVLLPEGSEDETRRRMQKLHPLLADMTGRVSGEGGSPGDVAQQGPRAPLFVRTAVARIRGLLQGEKDDLLDLLLDMSELPPFHRRVYLLVRQVGPGETTTYGELARQLKEPAAARAVGQALAKNPFAPVVPCHRVLAAGSRPLGYAAGGFSAGGGVVTKLRMLQIEGARLSRAPGLFD
jgi:methylated-DNA-[protein]-cysteine S-methyltransferase